MKFTVKCMRCSMQGYYGINQKDTCATCDGHGQFDLDGFESEYRKCPNCNASGYLGLDAHDECLTCHGLQYVHHSAQPLYRVRNDKDANGGYVDKGRLDELRNVSCNDFDLSKLIRILEELNSSSSNENYYSVAMLVRSVLDHVPPIFGKSTFAEVANNHSGRSFKEHMQHLDKSSRKVADTHLHSQIRSKEAMVTETQVDSRKDIDVLLGEIVRILK